MPAASTINRLGAFERIHTLLLKDAVAAAHRAEPPLIPASWPSIADLRGPGMETAALARLLNHAPADPNHPANWQRRAMDEAFRGPRVRDIYFHIKRSLWTWPEFTTLLPNARRILDVVVELARDEAFPWFVNVQADHVMRLACIDRKTFFDRLRDLECFTITRPARRIKLMDYDESQSIVDRVIGMKETWPSRDNNWCVDPRNSLENIHQWVIRYRRGTPYHKHRAAWWINYDLLCNTQRVLPCFEMCLDTLPKNYFDRNRRSGAPGGCDSEDGFKVLERRLAKHGPPPPPGLRAALWEGG